MRPRHGCLPLRGRRRVSAGGWGPVFRGARTWTSWTRLWGWRARSRGPWTWWGSWTRRPRGRSTTFCTCVAEAEAALASGATPADWESLRDTTRSHSGWYGVSPEGTGCAYEGSLWAAYFRRPGGGSASGYGAGEARPTKLVVDFMGGGACFSDATCASGAGNITFADRMIFNSPAQIAFLQCAPQGTVETLLRGLGILDYSSAEANPFGADAGYAHLLVSYCTGDVHAGGVAEPVVYKDTGTGDDVPIRHMGGVNVNKTLDWLGSAGLLAGLEEVVVVGESAGGVAASLWAWSIRSRVEAANGGSWNGRMLVFPDSFALRSRWSPNWDRGLWEAATSEAIGFELGTLELVGREGAADDGIQLYDAEAQAEAVLAAALGRYADDDVLVMEVNGKDDTTQGFFLAITDDLAPLEPGTQTPDADDIECRILQALHVRYCELKATGKYASWVANSTLHGFMRMGERSVNDFGLGTTPVDFLRSGLQALRDGTGAPASVWCAGCEPNCTNVAAAKAVDCAGAGWTAYLAADWRTVVTVECSPQLADCVAASEAPTAAPPAAVPPAGATASAPAGPPSASTTNSTLSTTSATATTTRSPTLGPAPTGSAPPAPTEASDRNPEDAEASDRNDDVVSSSASPLPALAASNILTAFVPCVVIVTMDGDGTR